MLNVKHYLQLAKTCVEAQQDKDKTQINEQWLKERVTQNIDGNDRIICGLNLQTMEND